MRFGYNAGVFNANCNRSQKQLGYRVLKCTLVNLVHIQEWQRRRSWWDSGEIDKAAWHCWRAHTRVTHIYASGNAPEAFRRAAIVPIPNSKERRFVTTR